MKTIFIVLISFNLWAKDSESVKMKSFDGFPIEVVTEQPEGINKLEIKKVVVFVHGSGAQNYDEDLSAVTVPKGTKNLFFKDLSEAFLKRGMATVRYNKRTFEVKKRIDENPNYKNSEDVKNYIQAPFEFLIKDALHFATYAQSQFRNAQVIMLGHSEGASVVLQAAQQNKSIAGTALIGFSNEPITSSLLEQFVYRSQSIFQKLDKNTDSELSPKELSAKSDMAASIKQQTKVLDLDRNGNISLSEFNAGNYSNLVIQNDFYNRNYLTDVAKLARNSEIVKDAAFKILFLQGEYDNQTPLFYSQSLDLANREIWKKQNLRFVYFPKSGHALDPRENLSDLNYQKASKGTLDKVADEIAKFY